MRQLAARVLWTIGAGLLVLGLGLCAISAMLWTVELPDG